MTPIKQLLILALLGALTYGSVSAQGTKGTQEGKAKDPGCCRPVPDPTVDKLTLQAPEFQLLKGQEVQVPIWLLQAKNVANMNWTLTYDTRVAVAEALVTKGNLLEGDFGSIYGFNSQPDPPGVGNMEWSWGESSTNPSNDKLTVACSNNLRTGSDVLLA